MSRRASALAPLVLLAAFFAGLTVLFQLRLGRGDVYPLYSTLRADPLGTRAFFESLRELPELQVERMTKRVERLAPEPARTIMLTGVERRRWESFSVKEANALEAAVRAGSRVVVAFKPERANLANPPPSALVSQDKSGKPAAKEKKSAKKDADEKASRNQSPRNDEARDVQPADQSWAGRWGVEIKERWILDRKLGALATTETSPGLPAQLPWKSDVFFKLAQGSDWRVLYTRGASPVMIEMRLGAGSVVLATDAYFLSNEALQRAEGGVEADDFAPLEAGGLLAHRHPALLAWLVGGTRHVVFCESILGVEEEPGIAALARRYGLEGAFLVLLLLAVLFVWRRAAIFVPPAATAEEVGLTYHPAASLEALLRRAVPAGRLLETCSAEWKRTARTTDVAKVEKALADLPPKASPREHYNAAVRALKRR
jgi:hypothetical protein